MIKKVFIAHIGVYTYKTDKDSRSKQSNFKYTTVLLLWNYWEYQKLLVTVIVYSQIIIYIKIHTNITQSKSISVVVILWIYFIVLWF